MKYVYLALLIIVSTVHLVDSYKDNSKNRAKTKGFLLPLILLFYLSSVSEYSWVLIAALITSWLGDVLLIPKGTKWFVSGGISFLISHILFIFTYIPNIDFNAIKWYIVIPVALIYFTVAGIIIKNIIGNTPGMMIAPMFAYLIANSTMNAFALMQLVSDPCPGSVIAYIGALLFFVSDCTLFLVRYHKKPDIIFKKHFTVMLTYITGELLITQGVIMLSGM